MTKFGGWNLKFNANGMPQKVATKVSEMNQCCGCGYEFVAYLADQPVNGTNHAVMLKQTVYNGRDSKNAVIAVLNEQPDSLDISIIDIHRIVESGGALGGTKIEMLTDIPEDIQKIWDTQFEGFTGSKIEPKVYLSNKMTKGLSYTFLAIYNDTEYVLVTINPMEQRADFERVFDKGINDKTTFGYAFTWLK